MSGHAVNPLQHFADVSLVIPCMRKRKPLLCLFPFLKDGMKSKRTNFFRSSQLGVVGMKGATSEKTVAWMSAMLMRSWQSLEA